jgi:uncharacterized protein YcbK (DUF882 family)
MGCKELESDNRIKIYGTGKEVARAKKILSLYPLKERNEQQARMMIQEIIDGENIKAHILINGNSIYSKHRILRNVKRLIRTNDMNNLSDYFYEFLTNSCGSIAHYSKHGWICEYPTVLSLQEFFERNEFGERAYNHVPYSYIDSREIILEIEELLSNGVKIQKETKGELDGMLPDILKRFNNNVDEILTEKLNKLTHLDKLDKGKFMEAKEYLLSEMGKQLPKDKEFGFPHLMCR